MPFKKGVDGRGGKRPGAGRKKGGLNKTTYTMRAAFTLFVEHNIPNFQRWMERVARENPAEALTIAAKFSEFCLPKLMRTEVTGQDGNALLPPQIGITFNQGGPGRGGVIEVDESEPLALIGNGTTESEA